MNNIITIFIIVPLLAFLLLGLNWLLSDNRPYNSKLITYECGYDTIPLQTRSPYEVQIWTVGLFFLAFDLELVSIYPAALIFSDMDYYGFFIFLVFNLILIIGFLYEYSSGAISLNKLKPLKNNNIDKNNILLLNKNIFNS